MRHGLGFGLRGAVAMLAAKIVRTPLSILEFDMGHILLYAVIELSTQSSYWMSTVYEHYQRPR